MHQFVTGSGLCSTWIAMAPLAAPNRAPYLRYIGLVSFVCTLVMGLASRPQTLTVLGLSLAAVLLPFLGWEEWREHGIVRRKQDGTPLPLARVLVYRLGSCVVLPFLITQLLSGRLFSPATLAHACLCAGVRGITLAGFFGFLIVPVLALVLAAGCLG